MIGEIRRHRRRTQNLAALGRSTRATIEALEDRRLFSITYQVVGSDGTSTSATVSPGQVLNLELVAIINSGTGSTSGDGFSFAAGSVLGTNAGYGPVAGDLNATLLPALDYEAHGASSGTQTDLNGDGNLDVGSNNNNIIDGFISTVANVTNPANGASEITTGTVINGALEIELATLTYTVKSADLGGDVDIAYRPRVTQHVATINDNWFENGVDFNETENTVSIGAPFVVSDPAAHPVGPVAIPDSSNAVTGIPQPINVLANDLDYSGTLEPAGITIVSAPNQGGSAVVDPTTGVITYTSTPTFFGTETFSYTVTDSSGATSAPATVTLTVSPTLPVANDDSVTTFENEAVVVPVLSNDTSSIGLVDSSLVLKTNPADGTAVINADGTVTYTPVKNFVGSDTFSYTVADKSGDLTNVATATVSVGLEISSAKGANKIVMYSDHDGTTATVTLSSGVADLSFLNSGTATTAHGKVVISGVNVVMNGILLSGTTAASVLNVKGAGGNSTVSVAQITDAGVLGKIIAPIANLTGTLNVAGVSTLQFASASGAAIHIGSGGSAIQTIHGGAMTNSSITTTAASSTIILGACTDSNLTAVAVKSLKIIGSSSGGSLDFSGAVGALNVVGSLADSTVSVGTPASGTVALGNLKVTGAITDSTVATAGDILSLVADSLGSDSITAGVAPSVTLQNSTAGNLGSNTIGNIRLTNRSGNAFSNTTILAHTIKTASLGDVPTDNDGVPEGVAAVLFNHVTAITVTDNTKSVVNLTPIQFIATPEVAYTDFEVASR